MKRIPMFVLAAAAGTTQAQNAMPSPLDAQAKTPAVHYRSVFESYRPYADQEPGDWRKANEAVRQAAQRGHAPGQGPGKPTSKPEPGRSEDHGAHHHGGHRK